MTQRFSVWRFLGLSLALLAIAAGFYIMVAGLYMQHVSIVTQATNKDGSVASRPGPRVSTVKPTPKTVAAYSVAPSLPKYLKIPSLGVNARVFAVGLDGSGAIGTPHDVFDTAWYTGSAKPGQPGAMLIDGHISSWTSPGVFYHLTSLKAGSAVQVVRGDDTVFNYSVVKTVIYPANKVNMDAALSPVTPGKNGLNLISCTGDVISGTSEFNERVVVFTEQTP